MEILLSDQRYFLAKYCILSTPTNYYIDNSTYTYNLARILYYWVYFQNLNSHNKFYQLETHY